MAALEAFDFILTYKAGKLNRDADALSRIPASTDDNPEVKLDTSTIQHICSDAQDHEPPILQCVKTSVTAAQTTCPDAATSVEHSGARSLPPKNVIKLQHEDPVIPTVSFYEEQHKTHASAD